MDQAAVVACESSGPPCFKRSRGRNEFINVIGVNLLVRLAETNFAAREQKSRQAETNDIDRQKERQILRDRKNDRQIK